MAAPARDRVRVKAPSLALLPTPLPRRSLLSSVLMHVSLIAVVPYIPLLIPPPGRIIYRTPDDLVNLSAYQPLTLGVLPGLSSAGSNGGREGGAAGGSAGKPAPRGPGRAAARRQGSTAQPQIPKAVYAGPQAIVSNPPDATNTVQTIRRPDLINAPKLKFPIRVQSMVVMPAPVVPVLRALPPPEKKEEPQAAPVVVDEASVERPLLPVHRPRPRAAVADPEAPKLRPNNAQVVAVLDVRNRPMPVLSPDAAGTGTKEAVVINGVALPPGTPSTIPNAELAGSFAVMPTLSPLGPGTPEGQAGGKGTVPGARGSGDPKGTVGGSGSGLGGGTGNGNDAGGGSANGTGTGSGTTGAGSGTGPGSGSGTTAGPGSGRGPGNGSGKGHGGGNGGDNGSGAGHGSGNGSGTGTGTGPGSGGGHLPGISIAGGSPGRGAGNAIRPIHRGYDVTIISAGSNGGASRDLGVFGRGETVYTVYITMREAGGGPDWPMQYAVLGGAPEGNGLVAPPTAVKKIPAAADPDGGIGTPTQVFVTGIIDEAGKLRGLRPLHSPDRMTRLAVETLEQWEFLPAELNGKPAMTKVMIGVICTTQRGGKRE